MRKQALQYHSKNPAGKTSVKLTKPCATQMDLSLAYTPGVAEPAKEIAKKVDKVFQYTNKSNLIGVITNGTAVLGLGNIGAEASKPVMEGKCVLFKRFAGLDAFDIELNILDPDKFIETVLKMEPTFGGINLEDIAAPECFYIENELIKKMSIPVFHDDQHGTAIISGAALLNSLELVNKSISEVKIVISGAGAAGIRCAEHYIRLGAKLDNICLVDSKGVINSTRKSLSKEKKLFAKKSSVTTLDEAMINADVFLGVSVKDIVNPDMLMTMAKDPIVMALANPDPEIAYDLAVDSRSDIIFATGRSDYPNQINNVLGFPFILRGALDVQATAITDNMKVAATKALAEITHRSAPASVCTAYQVKQLKFNREYIVPKPFDPRVLIEVSSAVAKAAIQDGVAKQRIVIKKYKAKLKQLSKQLIQV